MPLSVYMAMSCLGMLLFLPFTFLRGMICWFIVFMGCRFCGLIRVSLPTGDYWERSALSHTAEATSILRLVIGTEIHWTLGLGVAQVGLSQLFLYGPGLGWIGAAQCEFQNSSLAMHAQTFTNLPALLLFISSLF